MNINYQKISLNFLQRAFGKLKINDILNFKKITFRVEVLSVETFIVYFLRTIQFIKIVKMDLIKEGYEVLFIWEGQSMEGIEND